MIRLSLRLTVSGGREALARLLITAAAISLGVGLLLTTLAAVNAVHTQNARYAWFNTGLGADGHAGADGASATGNDARSLWWLTRRDTFHGEEIGRVDVAVTAEGGPVSPGVSRMPGAGEYYLSPALARLVDTTPPAQLGDRFPGHRVGILGPAALPAPDSLVALVGRTPAEMAALPGARQVSRIADTSPDECADCVVGLKANGVDLILTVATGALVFPVLILIGTATRLTATQRERRFAAMRLVGATPRQVSAVAAVESTVAAVAGVLFGFLPYLLLRGPVAGMALTGAAFYPDDLTLTVPQLLAVCLGVPVAAAVAARIALRRVRISPLGVSRQVTPKPPRAWRVLPLAAGLGELVFFLVRHPETVPGQIKAYLSAFLLIMLGVVLSGPWLTKVGAGLLAGRAQRPAPLIAVRRLADNPTAAFRAVSGLVLALLVTTATVGIITTLSDERGVPHGGPQFDNLMLNDLSGGYDDHGRPARTGAPALPGLTDRLHAVPGVREVLLVHPLAEPVPIADYDRFASEAVDCRSLDAVRVYGHCEPGAQSAYVPVMWSGWEDLSARQWPAAPYTVEQLAALPVVNVVVDTDGSPAAVEQARTMVDSAYPAIRQAATLSESRTMMTSELRGYQQLANVVILATFPIAGCSLAVSVAGGLSERKRPFSLLRLTGVPLPLLRGVVALESAVPLLLVSAVAIGIGFLAADLFLRSQLKYTLHAPGAGYYLTVVAGLAAALGIIAATLPLLRRITGPETARNE
ncbi:FtsX-like permease family protein [Kitasatospora sp. NPDC049285]|uniref:FtsX-like permease family protein n=1 Tax=Kitasatospora sp. NPDC049285 TaxID=3157096 RepID=UPI0034268F47